MKRARAAIARARQWLEEIGRPVSLGRRGERAAARYLRRRGYRIVTRNFRAAGAEIDLVAMQDGTLVFVEVKTRRTDAAGTAEEAVDERKEKQIRRAAEVFAARYRAEEYPMRFDVVAIRAAGRRLEIELLKDAF